MSLPGISIHYFLFLSQIPVHLHDLPYANLPLAFLSILISRSLGSYTHLTPLLLCCCYYYAFGGHCCTAVAIVNSLLATSILGFSFRRKLCLLLWGCRKPNCTHQSHTRQKADDLEVCFAFRSLLPVHCPSEKFVWWASCDSGTGHSTLEALQPSHRSLQSVSALYNLSLSTSASVCLSTGQSQPWARIRATQVFKGKDSS